MTTFQDLMKADLKTSINSQRISQSKRTFKVQILGDKPRGNLLYLWRSCQKTGEEIWLTGQEIQTMILNLKLLRGTLAWESRNLKKCFKGESLVLKNHSLSQKVTILTAFKEALKCSLNLRKGILI